MSKNRILIIEDNKANMELFSDLLEVAGYEVLKAETAEKGFQIIRQHQPDLILMDVALPGMDGLTATRNLKTNTDTQKIPIIAATSHAMKGDEEKILFSGCDGYIPKPIDTRTFAASITKILNNVKAKDDNE